MITYGWLPEYDCRTMEKTLDMVCRTFRGAEAINVTEIGINQGNTSRGIKKYLESKKRKINHTGVDNQRDLKMGAPFPESNFIIGNSIEVYTKIADESQHFVFIDGCHNYPMTMADFLVYSDKVMELGYIAFHDTGAQIKPFTDFQGMGDMADADMWIACRKAVEKLGLLKNKFPGWELILDEYDESFHTGGMVVVQKISDKTTFENYMNLP